MIELPDENLIQRQFTPDPSFIPSALNVVDAISSALDRCPWCHVFVNSAAGFCSCKEACEIVCCPQRNADNYDEFNPPAVPRFR